MIKSIRKITLIVLPILLLGIGTTTVLALNDPPKKTETPKSTPVVSTAVKADVAPTVAPVATPQPATVPAVSTPAPAPLYGEDPNSPGTFKVFDSATLMTQAGIISEDQAYANTVITRQSHWTYKATDTSINLCGFDPASKMLSYGSDYADNPITQLKACIGYIGTRYGGSWQDASVHVTSYNNF